MARLQETKLAPTSQTNTDLFEPQDGQEVDFSTLKYMAALSRHLAHEAVLEAFLQSGMTKSELATRLGYDKSRLSRLLNTPANVTVETLGELLFAIDGSAPVYGRKKVLQEPKRNQCHPEWLTPKPTSWNMSPSFSASPVTAAKNAAAYLEPIE